MDETSWRTYVPVEGKDGHQWWLWVVVTDDTVAYLLEPTRAGKVPRNHLGPDARGIALVDRLSAYGKLPSGVVRAFCWAHVRRDFVEVEDFYGPAEKKWARKWIERIARLYKLNAERVAAWGEQEAFAQKDRLLREAVEEMERIREEQLADRNLHEKPRKVLESLRNHWDGCTVFVEHPEVPMDNNESERWLRRPACGRKNYYGCGSEWSADLTAILFSLFATLEKNNINPEKWLSAYLATCAQAGGEAPEGEELEAFLPWNLPEERRQKWKLKEEPNDKIPPATTEESAPRGSPLQREGLLPGGDPLHAQADQLGAGAVPGGTVAAGV
jgi:transposase